MQMSASGVYGECSTPCN